MNASAAEKTRDEKKQAELSSACFHLQRDYAVPMKINGATWYRGA